jgi:hypothetical protein
MQEYRVRPTGWLQLTAPRLLIDDVGDGPEESRLQVIHPLIETAYLSTAAKAARTRSLVGTASLAGTTSKSPRSALRA